MRRKPRATPNNARSVAHKRQTRHERGARSTTSRLGGHRRLTPQSFDCVRKVVGVKPNNNSQSLALRLLRLEVEQGVRGAPTKMWMRWCKEPYKDFQEKSQCDLQRVVALGFGYSSRAPLLFPNDATVVPERCFSVYNPRRSFDFVCASESDAEIFMLCLTRPPSAVVSVCV